MADRPIHFIRHAIGIDRDVTLDGEPQRNYFAACVGSDAERVLLDLVSQGLMRAGGTINDGEIRYYYATDAGIAAARDDERARRAAAGLRLWRVSYTTGDFGLQARVVLAKSRAAAKWDVARDLMGVGVTKEWCFRHLSTRVVERARRARAAGVQ